MLEKQPETPESFAKKYITSREMVAYLGISRAAFLYGRRSGKIKAQPVSTNPSDSFVWERALVADDLFAWKQAIVQRQDAPTQNEANA